MLDHCGRLPGYGLGALRRARLVSLRWRLRARQDRGAHLGDGAIRNFARHYDMVADALDDDPDLLNFLASRTQQYDLPARRARSRTSTATSRRASCAPAPRRSSLGRSRAIRYAPERHGARGHGLGRDPEMTRRARLDLRARRRSHPGVIVGQLDRDGVGAEGAPDYSWGGPPTLASSPMCSRSLRPAPP